MPELMAVVVIVSILATVAVASFRRQLNSAKTTEVMSVIRSIAAAQERYRGENLQYLNVSTNLTSYYPMESPGKTKYHWVQAGGNNFANWMLLGVTVPGPVQFGYAVVAGNPGTSVTYPTLSTSTTLTFPENPSDPWYVIQATGDVDENGVNSIYVAASFRGEVYSENEGE